ncbi:chemotaxis regulatin CheY-phosphate phosphatase CheZ [Azospirillum fermentarium]|uniref:protein phosphatase CheZ n=1 Tax=Azospirillum fermentarium TaxID=1233114 RepID=UPI0022266A06|nr:protein phosphatase CheZ [Azospirillum fermentarium]MCW2247156.1 chemotaxis regulatin CheY-phosphate phosphatase CheZ [Azospirillum fermentarium]
MEQLPQLTEEEFEQIEEAVARTAKGRAFLRRYHRRAMGAASEEIRGMLQDFRRSWDQNAQAAETVKRVEVLRRELMEMAASIERARREVAALRPPDTSNNKIVTATSELDAIVTSTERASFEILNAAERLMDLSSRLRADGAASDLCSDIESEVTNIFTACSFQDLTGQRTSKVINALRYIEQRVNAMIGIWGDDGLRGLDVQDEITDHRPDAHLLNGPQMEGKGVSQADVDSLFDSPAPMAAPAPAPVVMAAPPPPPPPAALVQSSQADIDSLFDSPAPAAPTPAPAAKASQADIDSLFDSPAPAAPAPAPAAKASQADIDSLFDGPVTTSPVTTSPVTGSGPKLGAKPLPKLGPKPGGAKPAAAAAAAAAPPKPPPPKPPPPAAVPKPEEDDGTPALDQSAIDALFG